MRTKLPRVLAVLTAMCLLVTPVFPEDNGDDASGPAPTESKGEGIAPAEKVRMVEFRMKQRRVVGRLIDEKEGSLKVRIPGSGTITFEKGSARDLKRYRVSRTLYHEKLGDYYLDQTWDFETDEKEFANAIKAYLQAIAGAAEGEQKERLRNKYKGAAEQRRAWQEESMRREKLKKAQAQAEAARLQEKLARKKLGEFESLARTVKKLRSETRALSKKFSGVGTKLGKLQRHGAALEELVKRNRRSLHRLHEDVEWLEDEVDDLEDHIYYDHY
jgi:hypothetical protein